jgi:hypothetical protein
MWNVLIEYLGDLQFSKFNWEILGNMKSGIIDHLVGSFDRLSLWLLKTSYVC